MAVYLRKATAPSGAGELNRPLREEMPKLGSNAVPVLMEVIRAGMANGEDLNKPVLILSDIGKPAQPQRLHPSTPVWSFERASQLMKISR